LPGRTIANCNWLAARSPVPPGLPSFAKLAVAP
jgi:hypothetical protein